ncbi:SDR family oxidoreductase [bacterium]|nr:SDR family oxidoreductase [bacterium]
MKRLLLTGASGFVGSEIIRLGSVNWEIHGTWNHHPVTMKGCRAHEMALDDEPDIVRVFDQVKPHAVIHAAAWTDVDGCEKEPDRAHRINAGASAVIASKAAETGARLIYVSSDMVFDGTRGNYSESDAAIPVNVYGKTKLAGEHAVMDLVPDALIARSALIYGHSPGHGNSFTLRMLENFRSGKPMSLFTDQIRSPVWVTDLAGALLELADNKLAGILHLGSPLHMDRYTFGCLLAEAAGFSTDLCRPVRMSDIRLTAPRPRNVSFCTEKVKKYLKTGFMDCRSGIEAMFRND